MGFGTKIGAAMGAVGAGTGGAVAPLADRCEVPPAQDHAIYQDIDNSRGSEIQAPVEQQETQPDHLKTIGEMGKTGQDLAGTFASAKEGKDNADENLEASNEYKNAPAQGDPPDYSPRSENQILDDVNQGKYGEGFTATNPDIQNNESSPSNDDGYDYYSGPGY